MARGDGSGRRGASPLRRGRRGPLETRVESGASQPPGDARPARHGQQLRRVTLTVAALILGVANRVRQHGLEVVPEQGVDTFEVTADALRVPSFGRLGGSLLYAAATAGVEDAWVVAYLDSVLGFAAGDDRRLAGLRRHRRTAGGYPTTEAYILRNHAPDGGILPEERGLCTMYRCAGVRRARGPRPPASTVCAGARTSQRTSPGRFREYTHAAWARIGRFQAWISG